MKNKYLYLGLILRANISEETFWEVYYNALPAEVAEAFLKYEPQQANAEAHKMHLANPEIRSEAFEILSSSRYYIEDMDEGLFGPFFFENGEEACRQAVSEVNEQLTSYEAEAKPRWCFLYDHTEIDELGPNPWRIEIVWWEKSIDRRTLEIIVNQVLNI